MQKFIVTIDSPLPVASSDLALVICEFTGILPRNSAITVTEIPQPPFPSGMDKNMKYGIQEIDAVSHYPRELRIPPKGCYCEWKTSQEGWVLVKFNGRCPIHPTVKEREHAIQSAEDQKATGYKFIPEVEAGIEIVTEQIMEWLNTSDSVNFLIAPTKAIEDIIRRVYSAGWENGAEYVYDKGSEL